MKATVLHFEKDVLPEDGKCALCKKKIHMKDFVDEKSIAEYEISRLCQKCQDKVFGGSDDYV